VVCCIERGYVKECGGDTLVGVGIKKLPFWTPTLPIEVGRSEGGEKAILSIDHHHTSTCSITWAHSLSATRQMTCHFSLLFDKHQT